MEEIVRKEVITILEKARSAIKEYDSATLYALSDELVASASIFQDEVSIAVAVAVYALAKVVQNAVGRGMSLSGFDALLGKAIDAASVGKDARFEHALEDFLRKLRFADNKLNVYIQSIFDKAKLKKGANITESGPSIARAARLLGISPWHLTRYIGLTRIDMPEGVGVLKRIEFARTIFR